MDTSNPVMTSDRSTVSEILERSSGVKRQDLAYLGEVARTAKREILRCTPTYPPLEVRQILADFKAQTPSVPNVKEGDLDPEVFEEVMEKMPVCGLMDSAGQPLHPPGKNQRGGYVTTTRQFGLTPGLPLGLAEVAAIFGPKVCERKHIYTSGTWAGFTTRLKEQMSRKTVPVFTAMSRSVGAKKLGLNAALDMLDKWMPRSPNNNWPGIHGTIADALLDGIKVTSNASAGAPYWRNKGECMEQIVDVGLPLFVRAIKDNSLGDLWRKNPEMFLCEVKNKLDRYKIDELTSKTRPYVSVPAHVAFLVSMLSQGFQETLHTFEKNPVSSNAYGFSSTNGGLEKMVVWMEGADERGRVCAYGDDARIAVRVKGKIWIVDPDFKQMDGSIDSKDIELTIEWILRHVRKDLGDETPHFWQSVAQVWKFMAVNPHFIVDGTKIYRKKSRNGLMTGIPGTTLFDTVKSVAVWNLYLDHARQAGFSPLDEGRATAFMKENGLIIKPGTWNPAQLPEYRDGQLMTDHKFLGMQILCLEKYNRFIFVPTLPMEEALEMLVVQKDNPFQMERVSRTCQRRTLYERMRGLYITFGFSIPEIEEAIHNVVNSLPPEIILMQIQSGSGERPEHITLQDFNYPDSSGFPTREYCYNLYAGIFEDHAGWIQIFPTLKPLVDSLKVERRGMGRELRLALTERGDKTMDVVAEEVEPPNLDDSLQEASAMETARLPAFGPPNPRSFIARIGENCEPKPEKRLPTQQQVVYNLVRDLGMTQVGTVMQKTGLGATALLHIAETYGLYLTGNNADDIMSIYPLATPARTEQEILIDKWKSQRDHIDPGTSSRRTALVERARTVVRTAPEEVFLDVGCFVDISLKDPRDVGHAVELLNEPLTRLYGGMRWTTKPVRPNTPNPVTAVLEVGLGKVWERVAEARSVSKKMAKEYIASAIFRLNGKPLPTSAYTATANPPPAQDWADEVEAEDINKGPFKEPKVTEIQATQDWDGWYEMYPRVPREFFPILWRHALSQDPSDPEQAYHRVLSVKQNTPPDEPHESKRSRLSKNQRQRQNRALNKRRRQRRTLAPQMLP
nr:MAG: putative RNA-dependent RNA polymerase [Inari permutotetravirus]